MITESHCHIDTSPFAADADAVLERGRAVGVGAFLVVGTAMATTRRTADFVRRRPDVLATVGVHPHHAAEPGEDPSPEMLVTLANELGTVGLGEAGLDFNRNRSPRGIQELNFRHHVVAALASSLPLVIHSRDADNATMALLDESDPGRNLTGVLHCFVGGRKLAEFGVERSLPLSSLLIETDAPYLSPEPVCKQRRNGPANILHTVAMLAELHGETADTVADITTANFGVLFRAGRR